MKRPGWRRITDPQAGKCWQRWIHVSGYVVEHCGHPTALTPWALYAPGDYRGTLLAHPSGRAWHLLREAMEAAEGLLRGEYELDRLELVPQKRGTAGKIARRCVLFPDSSRNPGNTHYVEEIAA